MGIYPPPSWSSVVVAPLVGTGRLEEATPRPEKSRPWNFCSRGRQRGVPRRGPCCADLGRGCPEDKKILVGYNQPRHVALAGLADRFEGEERRAGHELVAAQAGQECDVALVEDEPGLFPDADERAG